MELTFLIEHIFKYKNKYAIFQHYFGFWAICYTVVEGLKNVLRTENM